MSENEVLADNTLDETASKEKRGGSAIGAVLRLRDFRLLWIGEGISVLGDQFYMIALPWLVLQLTNGDALATGTVLAVAGIPRALFMLIGGVITDRFSPRGVMLVSNILRMILVMLLTALILTEAIQLWMLYALALAFGLVDAFFYPASSAIVPQIVDHEHLQAGNAIIQGTIQISLFAGPLLAGLMIYLLGSEGAQVAESGEVIPDMRGIGLAFGFDALTFLASAITLWLMRVRKPKKKRGETGQEAGVLSAIREGLAFVWNDATLRVIFLLIAASNLLINGPLSIGIPVLAATRLPEGAAAFGIVMSAFGGGMLLGTILAGVLPRPSAERTGIVLIVVWSSMGIGIALLGLTSSTLIAALITGATGIADGYVVIIFITWLQRYTPMSMLGRMMSLLMFASVGLIPVSSALTGALIALNMTALFIGAGGAMAVLVLAALALYPPIRSLKEPEAGPEEMSIHDSQEILLTTQEMRALQ